VYTNRNHVNGIALDGDVLWAATGGGVVAWDLTNGDVASYTVLDGLPTNHVADIVVCPVPDPRVIAGTEDGLAFYDPDSDTWDVWTKDNSDMSKSDVKVLDCDPDTHTLFVGHTFGLDVWNSDTGEWTLLNRSAGLASDFVNHAVVIGDDLWIVSSFGVSIVHADGSIDTYQEETSDIPDQNVFSVVGDAEGNVWLGAFDGLIKFTDGEWTLYNSDSVEEFPFLDVFAGLVVAPDGNIWAGNSFGSICRFDPAAEKCLSIYDGEEGMVGALNDLIVDDAGSIYYCDDSEGISIFDGDSWQSLILEELAVSNSYKAIAFTSGGTIWLGGSFGLQTLSASEADGGWKHNEMRGHTVNTFFLGQEGIWIGHGAGASYAKYGTDTWTNLERGDPGEGIHKGGATAIAEDGAGRVWFGTRNGLTVWDGETFIYYDLLSEEERAEEKSARAVNALLFDGSHVWVGAYSALFRFDENDEITRWDELPVLGGLPRPTAYSLALQDDGSVLLGIGKRLMQYRDDQFEEVVQAPGAVHSILLTDKGETWLGLDGAGIYYNDGGEWALATAEDGLPSRHFGNRGIVMDELGTIWFAAEKGGLARYVP
jgi:ligand-binding sensor domain-containing protein